jgi:3',5'-cyclic AMP phosphodiesterase CpdA
MLIAQITDLHIGFMGAGNPCDNTERLDMVLSDLRQLKRQPDIILITGDLVEGGEPWAYEKLKTALDPVETPYYFGFGNHDKRDAFTKVFSDEKFNDGFLQYTIDDWPMRIIMLDTLGVGRHGGAFCEARAKWLRAKLSEQPNKPTLIALHHPPINTGIDWMTASVDNDWVQRLRSVIESFDNVVQIISGHIHRSIFKGFAGTTVSVSRAVAPQVKLELASIDPEVPDGRPLIVNTGPGYCLLDWDGESLTTHHGVSPEGDPIISYDEKHAHVVKLTMDIPS